MINGHQSAVRAADWATGIFQTLKGLRGSHLMDEMSVCSSIRCGRIKVQATRSLRHTDIQQTSAIILLVDDVVVKDLIVQGLWFCLCRRHGVCKSVAKLRSSKSGIADLYFAAPAMSLGTSSRGNADFGRSATNIFTLIGHRGELRGPRCRRSAESARRLQALVVACYFDSLIPGIPDETL